MEQILRSLCGEEQFNLRSYWLLRIAANFGSLWTTFNSSGSLAIFTAIRRASAPRRFDESAISIDAWAREIGGAMDARAAPPVGFTPNKVRALIAKYLGIDVKQVTDEAHFRNDFDLGSLDRLELLILIEDEFFGVEISDDAIREIEVVGDLIRYMEINYLLGRLYVEPFRRSAA